MSTCPTCGLPGYTESRLASHAEREGAELDKKDAERIRWHLKNVRPEESIDVWRKWVDERMAESK